MKIDNYIGHIIWTYPILYYTNCPALSRQLVLNSLFLGRRNHKTKKTKQGLIFLEKGVKLKWMPPDWKARMFKEEIVELHQPVLRHGSISNIQGVFVAPHFSDPYDTLFADDYLTQYKHERVGPMASWVPLGTKFTHIADVYPNGFSRERFCPSSLHGPENTCLWDRESKCFYHPEEIHPSWRAGAIEIFTQARDWWLTPGNLKTAGGYENLSPERLDEYCRQYIAAANTIINHFNKL